MITRFVKRVLAVGMIALASLVAANGDLSAQTIIITDPVDVVVEGDVSAMEDTAQVRPPRRPRPPVENQIDFNGDGYGDLAIGVPSEANGWEGAEGGEVIVLYGKAKGLTSVGSELWTQATAGSTNSGWEHFGSALAAADFNGDGYSDLAVGATGERFGNQWNAGQVNVIYGSAAGLVPGVAAAFNQNTPGIEGVAEEGDEFGRTLETGDFNGDGYDDLAVGVPYEGYEADGLPNMGAVNIIYGSAGGLTTAGNAIIHLALAEVSGTPAYNGMFAFSLAAGDFDGDGIDDLGVGIPNYELANEDEVGAVEVFFGSPGGISLLDEQLWRQGLNGVQGNPEIDDDFGAALAAGDFDNNGVDDLAIGAPGEDLTTNEFDFWDAGAVHILYGYSITDGLSGAGDQLWHRNVAGINGELNTELRFGNALLAANFDGTGGDDLAVGVPGDNPTEYQQGSVQVFYSNGAILAMANQDFWAQGTLKGTAEDEDHLGFSLGTADFDGDGYPDLATGAPWKDFVIGGELKEEVGAVNVIYGTRNGLVRTGNQFWHKDSKGIVGDNTEYDLFGYALSR